MTRCHRASETGASARRVRTQRRAPTFLYASISGLGTQRAFSGPSDACIRKARVPHDFHWPVPVEEYADFAWHLAPAGALHGAILALCAFLGSRWLRELGWAKRLPIAVATGWIAGCLSWQPLRMSLDGRLGWSAWPFNEPWSAWFIGPLQILGLVACLSCLVRWDHSGGGWRMGPGTPACSTAPSGGPRSVLHGGALPSDAVFRCS